MLGWKTEKINKTSLKPGQTLELGTQIKKEIVSKHEIREII